jgi:CRISPR-associated protein Cas1
MIRRTLFFSQPAYLSLKDEQLLARLPDQTEHTFPVEDLGYLVLEHPQITLTHGLLARLQHSKTAVVVCDTSRMPCGQFLPYASNNESQKHTLAQIKAGSSLKKNLWQQTVLAKISNQASLLESKGLDAARLRELAKKVRSGDKDNAEAQAARYYWQALAPLLGKFEPFLRDRYGLPPNNLLNYGYAILRAVVARGLAGSGLLPVLGIFHSNKYNAFGLADDIMEPFRPMVDKLVLDLVAQAQEPLPQELDKELKKPFLALPAMDVGIDGDTSPLMVGLQRTSASLVRCYLGEARKVVFPTLVL